jgi:hypothetical protein
VSLLNLFQLLFRLLKCCLSNLLFVLTGLQGFRQFIHLFLKINVRGLSEGETALEFLGLLGKLLVCLLLFSKPLNCNFPEHRMLEGVVLLKTCQLRRRVRVEKILEF